MDASWGYDHHNDRYVYGYKVPVVVDSDTGLPIMLTVTGTGYRENKTPAWFISTFLKISIKVRRFFADMAYDSNATKLRVARIYPSYLSTRETVRERTRRSRKLEGETSASNSTGRTS